MLRQRLILISIPVIGLIILITIAGLWFLQGMFGRIQHLNDEAWVTVDRSNQFNANVHDCQKVMHEYLSHPGQIPSVDVLVASAREVFERIAESSVVKGNPNPDLTKAMRIIGDRLPAFLQGVQKFPHASDVDTRRVEAARLVADAEPIEAAIGDLMQIVREEARSEQGQIASSFRYGLVGLSIGFILILNVVILSFIRVISTVQRPMDLLVRTARSVDSGDSPAGDSDPKDEFDQLADILNRMAKQVQTTEASRLEVLGQVATAMNHELNNAINIIELQLKLLSRNSDTPQMQAHIKQIHETLQRMTRAVETLRQARRIVLTDYVGGTKMLDLQRSAEAASVEDAHAML